MLLMVLIVLTVVVLVAGVYAVLVLEELVALET